MIGALQLPCVRAVAVCALLVTAGCDTPNTNVVLDDNYPPTAVSPSDFAGLGYDAATCTTTVGH